MSVSGDETFRHNNHRTWFRANIFVIIKYCIARSAYYWDEMEFFSSSKINYQMFYLLWDLKTGVKLWNAKNLHTIFISGREKSVPRNISMHDTGESQVRGWPAQCSPSYPLNLHSQFSGREQNSCEKYIVYKLISYQFDKPVGNRFYKQNDVLSRTSIS